MKLHKIILGTLLCTAFLSACKDDEETIPTGITTDLEEIAIGPEGGLEQISLLSDGDWVAGTSRPWVAVSPANGLGSAECKFAIDSTLESTARIAQVRFMQNNGESKIVTITQMGFGKQILLKEPEVEIKNSDIYKNRFFEATITTNVDFKIDESKLEYAFVEEDEMSGAEKTEWESERANWITMPAAEKLEVNLDRKARPRTIKVNFRWEMNTAPYTRIAKIHLVPRNPEDQLVDAEGNPTGEVVLTVKQKPALKITDDRAGDSLAVITINEKAQGMMEFNTSENMRNWDYLTLWEATDKDLPEKEAIGRVRSVKFMLIDLKDGESLPKEIRHLKYLENFTIQSNPNSQLRNVSLGEEICGLKYLKYLTVFAYGMCELPENFASLGKSLVTLSLESNNFATLSMLTDVINQKNFPKLTRIGFGMNRRNDVLKNLTQISGGKYNDKPVGMYINFNRDAEEKAALMELLTWDNLLELSLSYNFIEGHLPSDAEMEAELTRRGKAVHYNENDFFTKEELENTPSLFTEKLSKDTCQWLTSDREVTFIERNGTEVPVIGQQVLRVLPRMRAFSINLNFLNGKLPNWILFHPYFAEWFPETFIFGQELAGKNSAGEKIGFTNIDPDSFDFTYYYGDKDPGKEMIVPGVAYPLYYRRYVANTTWE